MNKGILLSILTLTACLSFAQVNWTKAEIKDLLAEYTRLIDKEDVASSLDYMHPALFEIASKELMISKFEEMYNDPELQVKLGGFEVKKISNIISYKSINYSLIDYNMNITMTHSPEEGSSEADTEQMYEFLLGIYETKYGKENVQFDEEDKSFVISLSNQMFAIGDPEIGSWKILENKEGMEEMLGDVVPKKVKKKLAKL